MHKRIKSFKHAIDGLMYAFCKETHMKIHLIAAILVVCLGFCLQIGATEWLIILLAIGLVIVTELINTAIERLADVVSKEIHPQIKIVKDVAAGAVLFSSIIAAIIGLLVFLPKVWHLITG